jgi:hypothetical protein
MIRTGILTEEEPLELLEGWIAIKMARNPEHDLTLERVDAALRSRLPAGWRIRIQCAITTDDSEPEPDLAVVRGPIPAQAGTHPRPQNVGLLVEVADSSLDHDRTAKARTYARAAIPIYWIVNLPERQVEVYTDPTGPDTWPVYRTRRDHAASDTVPFVLDGREIAHIPVSEMLL